MQGALSLGGTQAPASHAAALWKGQNPLPAASWRAEQQKLPLLRAQFRKLNPPKLDLSMKVSQMVELGTTASLLPPQRLHHAASGQVTSAFAGPE